MTKEILKEEILKDEQLDNVAGGAYLMFPRERVRKFQGNDNLRQDTEKFFAEALQS